jgi:hypothetical protein
MKTTTFFKITITFLFVFFCLEGNVVYSANELPCNKDHNTNKPACNTVQWIGADNPNIQYTGRIDFSNPKAPRFWNPGVYVKAKFVGTSCKIVITDEVKWGKNHNYLEIVVDDSNPYRIQTAGKTDTITVAENLTDGEHTVLICKDTEVNIGYMEFLGLICKGIMPLPAKPERKIEFIGNSITCGTGSDLSKVKCGAGQWQDQHNAYMAYGPVAARMLNAQWQLSSYSGIGLIHSCCGITFTMPDVFDKLYLTPESPAWDFNRYVPDVVTICLGQNDGVQDSSVFCGAYVKFIRKIKGYYPNAQIICLTSPMADASLTRVMKNYLSGVVDFLNKSGDQSIHKFFFSRSYNSGCDNHPDLHEHQLIAQELEPFIKGVMGW